MKLNYRNNKNAEATAKYWGKTLDKSDWYKIENKSEDETEILIYDVIGWPFVDADTFVREISNIKSSKITLRLNSPGGDVFDGFAIHNALKAHKANVTIKIEGLAASIASVVAMAGDVVESYSNAMIMIHNSWSLAMGNKDDMRDVADILEKIDGNLVDTYFDNSNVGRPTLRKMMEAETWLTAKEAKDKGFIDNIISGDAPKASFDLSIFAHAPDGIVEEKKGKVLNKKEVEKVLRDAGASRTFAKSIAAGCSNSNNEDEVIEALKKLNERIK